MTKDVLPKLANQTTPYAIDKSERKISWQVAVRAGKELILFISNEDMDNIKIVESLENQVH